MSMVDLPPAQVIRLIRELSIASGPIGMIGGQVLDMEGEDRALSSLQFQRISCKISV